MDTAAFREMFAERKKNISQIMPNFWRHACKGLKVYQSLNGDPLQPDKWKDDRPEGTICSVEYDGDRAVKMRVDFEDGRKGVTFRCHPQPEEPEELWEFSDDPEFGFEAVVRKLAAEKGKREARGKPVNESPEELVSRVDRLNDRMQKLDDRMTEHVTNSKKFDRAIVRAMSKVKGDFSDDLASRLGDIDEEDLGMRARSPGPERPRKSYG